MRLGEEGCKEGLICDTSSSHLGLPPSLTETIKPVHPADTSAKQLEGSSSELQLAWAHLGLSSLERYSRRSTASSWRGFASFENVPTTEQPRSKQKALYKPYRNT